MVRDRIMIIPVLSIVVLAISGCSDTQTRVASGTNTHSRFASGPSQAQYQQYTTRSGQKSSFGSNAVGRSQWFKADPQYGMEHPHPVVVPQHQIVYHPDPDGSAGPPNEDPAPILMDQGNVYIHETNPAQLIAEQQERQNAADAADAADAARAASARAAAQLVPGSLLQRNSGAATPPQAAADDAADAGGKEQ
jgi:hypothetical protein